MADGNKIYDKFDHDVLRMIIFAKAASLNAKIDCIYPECFIIGMLTTGENLVTSMLIDQGIDLEKCLKTFKARLAKKKSKKDIVINYENLKRTKQVDEIVFAAYKISTDANQDLINLQHVFLATLDIVADIKRIFEAEGLNIKSTQETVKKSKSEKPLPKKDSSMSTKTSAILESFCTNLTDLASKNKLDPIIARDAEIEEAITILCRRNKSNPILVGAPGVGKCLAKGTKVLKYSGEFELVENIKVGDLLMGVDSTPRKILSLGHGFDEMFEIEQNHGDNYIVNSAHILSLRKTGTDEIVNININDYNSKSRYFRENLKGWKTGVDFKKKELPIDPYFLGLWLGDGTSGKAQITNIDKEIINYCEKFAKKNKHKMIFNGITMNFTNMDSDKILQIDNKTKKMRKFSSMREAHQAIKKQESGYITSVLNNKKLHAYGCTWKRTKNQNSIYQTLKTLNLINNKHIPDLFKINDEKSRLSLLAGIIDSDGHYINNCYEIVQKNKKMSLDIVFLARSLGYNVSIVEKIAAMKREDGSIYKCPVFRMCISGHTDKIPCKVERKKAHARKQVKNVLNTGIKIKPIGRGEYFGFTIDGDHLFILGDFTVTHNTAIIEGIAQRIVSNTVPKKLIGSKIYSLNLGCLVAGTKYRGEFEKRLQDLLKELKDDPSCILFIDEIHTIIGAGSASGSVDTANMLKPALARDLKCIGATTHAEYKKYFIGDGALERRFEKIDVEEPNQEQVKRILLGIKPKLETYHNCIITDDAIDAAIKLTARYCSDKNFPDKAIDCLDTACAKFAWKEDSGNSAISPSDVAMVVSKKTQIPIEVMLWDNYERIKNTEKILKERVIGQDYAVKSICRTLKNAYSGIRNPEKPIGIFVFGGQTGTGKTYLTKELSKTLFNNENSFIKIDMSEYSEPHSISKIIGSPPGYVGFNEVDVVADKIRRKPYCVLLIDEMEKAHPDVIKLFLQVMSDGKFTDAIGNKVNCKNMILIFTGNFGMNDKGTSAIGFDDSKSKEEMQVEQQRLIDFCKGQYGAEFVNRVDDFIAFLGLSDEHLAVIAKLRLNDFLERIHNKNCDIVFHDDVPAQIVALSKKEHGMNANLINRLIEKNLETCVADAILDLGDKINDKTIEVSIKDDKFNITYKTK